MKEKKKIVLLIFLLLVLAGILGWQWLRPEPQVPAVKDETEHRALATLIEMLEAGRRRGWPGTRDFWAETPDRQLLLECQRLLGRNGFRSEFTFQGSAPVEGEADQLVLYGIFESGVPVEIQMVRRDDQFKIVSMAEM